MNEYVKLSTEPPGPATRHARAYRIMVSLAEQLKAIRPSKTSGVRGAGGGLVQRPSLLFTPSEAADLDSDAIFSIGISGLAELTKLDPTLSRFEKTLFIRSSTDFRREQQTADILRVSECNSHEDRNGKVIYLSTQVLDASIGSILRALCPFYLLRPAHKVIEFLIRRYVFMSASLIYSPVTGWRAGTKSRPTTLSSCLNAASHTTPHHNSCGLSTS